MAEPDLGRYRTIVAGTDGSALAAATVTRAALAAVRENADLVLVCAYSALPRRLEAKNVATTGGDARLGQVLGKAAASSAVAKAVGVAETVGATITAALLVDAEPAKALLTVVDDHDADLLVIGARSERTIAERIVGTVAEEVTKRAPCDVLIVRPRIPGEIGVPESGG